MRILPTDHRKLYAVWCLCLALIGLAASVKMNENPNQPGPSVLDSSRNIPRLLRDSSFYQSAPTIPGKKAPVPKTPAKTTTSNDTSNVSGVTAQAYLVANVTTGKVYLERNSMKALPVASMSKLVTAFAATDILPATTTIEITPEELTVPPDGSNLKAGEKFGMNELLYPLLLNSSNVAAEALASTTDRGHFVELMSSYAKEIGMPSSYFADPTGLSPQNRANARDILALAQYLYGYRPDILAITRTAASSTATTTDHGAHTYTSIHPFINDPTFVGGKTGHTTEAGDTMLTILRLNGQIIAIVVLHSSDGMRGPDTTKLRDAAVKLNI